MHATWIPAGNIMSQYHTVICYLYGQLWDRKTESKTEIPFIVQKPVSSAVGNDGSFLFTAYTRKKRVFRI